MMSTLFSGISGAISIASGRDGMIENTSPRPTMHDHAECSLSGKYGSTSGIGMQPSPYRLGSKQIAIVLLLFGFSVMSYFDRTIMSIAGPDIMREYGLSETQMGTVYSAFIAAYAVLMIPGGHVADVLGPRMTLLLMGALAGLFTGLTPLTGRAGIGALFGAFP